MSSKTFLISIIFILNLLGVFPLITYFLNLPFKAFFGYINQKTKRRKEYWAGHIVTILLIFYAWEEITLGYPTLTLVITLLLSSIGAMFLKRKYRTLYRSIRTFYLEDRVNKTFMYILIFLYIIGLFYGNINFVVW